LEYFVMIKFKKISASSSILALVFAMLPQASFAEVNANQQVANSLMYNLKNKVNKSLEFAQKKPVLPADDSRLLMQCMSDEFQFQTIHEGLLLTWQNNWKKNKKNGLENLVTNNFLSENFSELVAKKTKHFDGITQVTFEANPELVSKKIGLKSLDQFTKGFKKVEFVELTTEKYLSSPATRTAGQKMNVATLWLRFDIRGESSGVKRLEERGMFKVDVALENNQWKISKIVLLENESLKVNQPLFKNITASSNVKNLVPQYLRREAIRRGGYALAVGDINHDNNKDLFIATVGETVLLKGQKDLTFVKSAQKTLNQQTLVKAAAFADFTNSGEEDLLLVRFAPNESQTKDDRSDIEIFKNNAGNFDRREKVITFNKETAYAMPLALADFNNDGLLDFYVGFPGAKDFTALSPAVHKKGLTSQGVFYNQGGAKFSDEPYNTFAKDHGNIDDLSKIFPHSALAVDFNQDGKEDLVVIDDRGNLSPLYINKGNGNFETSALKIGVGLKDYGMGVDVADLNGDGKLDFIMSAVNFNTSKRLKESCSMNWSVENVISAGVSGLRTFTANKDSTYTETTAQNGLTYTGEGAGGVKVFDYNNDGLPDIYLTNGLWSGSESDNSQDLSPYFVAASIMGILDDDLKSELKSKTFVYEKTNINNDFKALLFNSDSQSSIMDLLSFYRGDINGSNLKPNASLSLAGNQPNRMFRNNGDGTFTEVGYMLGIDSMSDGYMAATADLSNDGNLDLILRNADPGYAKDQFPGVEIFKNTGILKNNSVVLKLVGTVSNRDAVGTQVEATVGGKKIVEQVMGSMGTVQSERIIHIGLGKKLQIDNLKIIWPKGYIQNLKNVKAGFHNLEEPRAQMSQN
jgi:hypothetical protein